MTPDDPRHGTYSGGQAHIREHTKMCGPCHAAHLRYRRQRRYDQALGRPRMIPAQPVVDHLQALRDQGVTVHDIATLAGVSVSMIDELLNRPRTLIRTDNAAALLATTPPPNPGGHVPSLGTIRRVRALARLGWAMRDVAEASGGLAKLETLRAVNSDEPATVKTSTADGVKAAYAHLSMSLPPASRTASQVRTRAAMKGWPPPLAYDDIDTDTAPATACADESGCANKMVRHGLCDKHYRAALNPAAHYRDTVDPVVVERLLAGDQVSSTRAEKDEAMRRWKAGGKSEASLCAIQGWKDSRYGRDAA